MMTIDRLYPNELIGPRAYFTAFDYKIVSRSSNREKPHREIDRKLKTLLLLKSHIVCAASHLTSQFSYDFFKDKPFLLSEGHILPAFRSDKNEIPQLFEKKRFKNKNDAILFFSENIHKTVDWTLEDNSSWFRNRFLDEIKDPDSVISRNMSGIEQSCISKLHTELNSTELLSRAQIDRVAKDFPQKQRRLLLNFRELLYHISGARVVNCESSLPQENYIDYDLADLSKKRTRLSEEQILWKLFLETIFESFQNRMVPMELLDWLSYEDIIKIRKPLLESNFQSKYNELIEKVISEVGLQKKNIVFDINELAVIREKIEETFKNVFDEEIGAFRKKRFKAQAKTLAGVTSSLALSVIGLTQAPHVALVAGALSYIKDSPAFIFNVSQSYDTLRSQKDYELYINNKKRIIEKKLDKCHISDKSTMLDMVELLVSLIQGRMQI